MGTINQFSHLGKAYKKVYPPAGSAGEWNQSIPSQRRHHLHWVLQDMDFHSESGRGGGDHRHQRRGKSTLLR